MRPTAPHPTPCLPYSGCWASASGSIKKLNTGTNTVANVLTTTGWNTVDGYSGGSLGRHAIYKCGVTCWRQGRDDNQHPLLREMQASCGTGVMAGGVGAEWLIRGLFQATWPATSLLLFFHCHAGLETTFTRQNS